MPSFSTAQIFGILRLQYTYQMIFVEAVFHNIFCPLLEMLHKFNKILKLAR